MFEFWNFFINWTKRNLISNFLLVLLNYSIGFFGKNNTILYKFISAATRFFDPCEENAQCSEFLQGSICSGGNCTCEETHHGYGTRCVRSVSIGDTCTGIEECIPDPRFSEIANCIDRTCQCLPGAVHEAIGCNSCRLYYNFMIISVCLLYLFINK